MFVADNTFAKKAKTLFLFVFFVSFLPGFILSCLLACTLAQLTRNKGHADFTLESGAVGPTAYSGAYCIGALSKANNTRIEGGQCLEALSSF